MNHLLGFHAPPLQDEKVNSEKEQVINPEMPNVQQAIPIVTSKPPRTVEKQATLAKQAVQAIVKQKETQGEKLLDPKKRFEFIHNQSKNQNSNLVRIDLQEKSKEIAITHLEKTLALTKYTLYNGEMKVKKCAGVQVICGKGKKELNETRQSLKFAINVHLVEKNYDFTPDIENGNFFIRFHK